MSSLPSTLGESSKTPIRIMSLEDDEMSYLMLKQTILRDARLDCDFVWAASVDEAVKRLETEPIHLCFIDYNLGSEDGFELIRRLQPDHSGVPCILLTGYEDERLGDKAIEHGFYDYLVKERATGPELRRSIRHALERYRTEHQLRRMALRDPLTGLYNRAAFIDHVERMIKHHRRHASNFGVIYVDLDRFKAINDSGGHQIGDAVLMEVAARLRDTLRDSDIIARLGGDEFGICCNEIEDEGSLAPIAEKVIATLARPFSIAGVSYTLNASAGIAFSHDAFASAEAFIQATDQAMYEAKNAGGNRFTIHDRKLSERLQRRILLERKIVHALADDKITVAYQPIVDLTDGSVHAVEALARWHDDELGPIPPDEFIPIAEAAGLISAVSVSVFQQSMRGLYRLRQEPGYQDTRLSLNLSVRQLANKALAPGLIKMIREAGILPEHIEFEVTEGFFQADEDTLIDQIRKLRDTGARISVDDFGTGYSSLSRLKKYPLDAFKIDRSFVSGIDHDEAQRRLCAVIVELGNALNMQVVGEGIENNTQLNILRDCGCSFGQGYLFSRPLPLSDLVNQGQLSIAKALRQTHLH